MKHEPLTLIKPQFEVPMPALKPAVYPPIFRDCEPPSLELFDLEDYFASETSRLNQLTNKCSEQDLELFIKEFGGISGISSRMPTDQRGAKQILEFVVTQLFEFKRMYQPGVRSIFVQRILEFSFCTFRWTMITWVVMQIHSIQADMHSEQVVRVLHQTSIVSSLINTYCNHFYVFKKYTSCQPLNF